MWQHLSTYGDLELADLPIGWPLLPTCAGRLLSLERGDRPVSEQTLQRKPCKCVGDLTAT
eukprot:1191594-Prorocentrum_minimum.AAC.1